MNISISKAEKEPVRIEKEPDKGMMTIDQLFSEEYISQELVLEAPKAELEEAIKLEEQSANPVVGINKEPIEAYRQRYFANSPITADMIVNTSQHFNIPVGFILAVGHNESHMGTRGRAVGTMNPMNVGNTDYGDYKDVVCGVANNCLSDWEAGLATFGKLIRDCYFNEGETINLQTWIDRDFRAVRCGLQGKRYMTDWLAKYKYQERINNLKEYNINY